MSRPRKPFGSSHPGRLPATMMKVLAAEISDPQRLRRGKQYANDGSVLDIVIQAGVVSCEVQGSRSTPYVAQIEVVPGDGMPLRRDISTRCTCPDDDNWDDHACKHVVAAMFTMSNELLIEPELLDVWRQRGSSTETPRTRRHLTLVHSDATPAVGTPAPAPTVVVDPLEDLLASPDGVELPVIPAFEPIEPVRPKRQELADVLTEALRQVRVDWD